MAHPSTTSEQQGPGADPDHGTEPGLDRALTLLDARLGDGPPSQAAETELLATVLDISVEAAIRLSPDETRRALNRLGSLVRRLTTAGGTDELTGFLTREAGLAATAREMQRINRMGGRLVLALLAVDTPRRNRPSQDVEEGNRLLQVTAHAVQRHFRAYDIFIRFGNDELLCALPSADITSVDERMGPVVNAISRDEGDFELRASVGLAQFRSGDTLDGLIARADADLAVDQRRRRK